MVSTKATQTTSEITDEDGSSRTVEQTRITIPKGIADAVDAAGDSWEWEVDGADRLSIRRVDE